ncbi:MAG TPA: hypothetical protein VK766_02545 [Cytophagaceae bacterium]|jgi:hypothetical protein|nr:hypothetical protein [Cytophagaceae bacterium]
MAKKKLNTMIPETGMIFLTRLFLGFSYKEHRAASLIYKSGLIMESPISGYNSES